MTEPQLSPRILELLVSHICHDLVSPVGAINNGIEFVEEMGDDAAGDAMGLIGSSVRQASTTLQCYRLAYGGAGSGANVTFDDIKTAFGNFIEGSRAKLSWEVDPTAFGMIPEGFMKILLNTLIMAKNVIPANGDIIVQSLEGENGVKIIARAENVEFRDGVGEAFRKETALDDLTPRSVHGYVTAIFAEFFDITVENEKPAEGEMTFTVKY